MSETFYADGGYGYDHDRDHWITWVAKHYCTEFGLGDPIVESMEDELLGVDAPTPTLLDAGCGDGFWSGIFDELGFEVTGVDISEDAIATAEQKWPGPRYLLWDLAQPLVEDRYEVVFCRAIASSAYPLSPLNLQIMRNLSAALGPGGTFLFSRSSDLSGEEATSKISGQPAPQPKLSEFVAMVEAVGLRPFRCVVVGDMAQVATRKP